MTAERPGWSGVVHVKARIGQVIYVVDRYRRGRGRQQGDVAVARDTRTGNEKTKDVVEGGIDVLAVFFGSKNELESQRRLRGRKVEFDIGHIKGGTAGQGTEVGIGSTNTIARTGIVLIIRARANADVTGSHHHPGVETDVGQAIGEVADLPPLAGIGHGGSIKTVTTDQDIFHQFFGRLAAGYLQCTGIFYQVFQ